MVAGFLFKEYEVNQEGMVTGYQVILEDEQVATLEYRSQNQMWIGAMLECEYPMYHFKEVEIRYSEFNGLFYIYARMQSKKLRRRESKRTTRT